jgi:gluconolactonase
MTAQFEVLAEDLVFPEGPVAMPDGSVILVESGAGRLTRCWGAGRKEVVSETGGGPNGAALGPDGALYVCNNGGNHNPGEHGGDGRIERVDIATGKVDRLYDTVNGRHLSAPNDLVLDAEGGIWFTDFGAFGPATIGKGGLYWCRSDGGEAREAFYGGLGYNGVGLSPNGKSVYVATTWAGCLYRFGVEGPGRISQELGQRATPEHFVGRVQGDAGFDSLAVAASGSVCIATVFGGGITTITPAGERSFVAIPDAFVTNIAFGGADMRDAFITLSESGRLIRMRWSEPGLKLNFN